jgi:hypothetical protein
MLDDRCFAAVFSASGRGEISRLRSWQSQFSRVKNLTLTFGVVPGNGGFLVVPLLKALFGQWTFSRVKTQDLTIMVRQGDDEACALFPS